MTRVLLTAFEPYEHWQENASWTLVERLTLDLPAEPQITTRRYPVDFTKLPDCLAADLSEQYDAILLLGQAPTRSSLDLEAIGLNVALSHESPPEDALALVEDGPAAYRSALPLQQWARSLREMGVPARVSFHAGTYLCNAALYLTHYLLQQRSLPARAAFIHVPLDPRQAAGDANPGPSLPIEISTLAVRWMLDQLVDRSVV